jgi:hypothetical protein
MLSYRIGSFVLVESEETNFGDRVLAGDADRRFVLEVARQVAQNVDPLRDLERHRLRLAVLREERRVVRHPLGFLLGECLENFSPFLNHCPPGSGDPLPERLDLVVLRLEDLTERVEARDRVAGELVDLVAEDQLRSDLGTKVALFCVLNEKRKKKVD